MAEDPQVTYLVLLHGDNADQVPGLWVTQSQSLTDLVRRCSLRFNSVDIFEMAPQPSYVDPQYVQWGGMKMNHLARVEPSHVWVRGLNMLRNAMDDFSHEQAQIEVERTINKLVEFLGERLTQPNIRQLQPDEELVEITTTPVPSPSDYSDQQPNPPQGVDNLP